MEELCPKSHHSYLRITNVHTSILLIGHLESKVFRNLRDLSRPFGLNYSQHSSRHVTGNLLMLLRTKKGEVFMLRMHLPMSNQHSIFSSCAAIVLPFNPKK
ncbi:PREDICTED: uncharacterized protein LOC109351976 isoform X2 [Lupinus angustifolius]|uniref:uncharacterized protein LOC109351976 isoform X2 n=1 Tax=Lupinus angustifolius TaxID=3871 RepID=UPI00092E574B|nr:PREDICTED: uncharacterized protein LOC109351976 isoform X2 [Lupinus angustifolius]